MRRITWIIIQEHRRRRLKLQTTGPILHRYCLSAAAAASSSIFSFFHIRDQRKNRTQQHNKTHTRRAMRGLRLEKLTTTTTTTAGYASASRSGTREGGSGLYKTIGKRGGWGREFAAAMVGRVLSVCVCVCWLCSVLSFLR